MEPVTVTGVTAVTIIAPNAATVTVSDNGNPLDGTFLVDFNGGGETHAITGAGAITSITLQLGTGTNVVTIDLFDVAFDGTFTVAGRHRQRHRELRRGHGGRRLHLHRRRRHRHAGRPGACRTPGPSTAPGRATSTASSPSPASSSSPAATWPTPSSSSPAARSVGIDGGDAVLDVIDMSALTTAVTVNAETSAITGGTTVGSFEDIAVIVGSAAATDTIVGLTAGTTFLVTGVDAGFVGRRVRLHLVREPHRHRRRRPSSSSCRVRRSAAASTAPVAPTRCRVPTTAPPGSSPGANAGVMTTTDFINIERLVGGVANDRFRIRTVARSATSTAASPTSWPRAPTPSTCRR